MQEYLLLGGGNAGQRQTIKYGDRPDGRQVRFEFEMPFGYCHRLGGCATCWQALGTTTHAAHTETLHTTHTHTPSLSGA